MVVAQILLVHKLWVRVPDHCYWEIFSLYRGISQGSSPSSPSTTATFPPRRSRIFTRFHIVCLNRQKCRYGICTHQDQVKVRQCPHRYLHQHQYHRQCPHRYLHHLLKARPNLQVQVYQYLQVNRHQNLLLHLPHLVHRHQNLPVNHYLLVRLFHHLKVLVKV